MADEKRNIQGYEEMYAVRLAGGEVILAENKSAENRYMVCDCSWDNPLGAAEYSNGVGSADYLEIMKEFTRRLDARIFTLESERSQRGLPLEPLTAADCEPGGMDTGLEGRAVVISAERLAPEYRSADHQLAVVTGGFGASPNSRGRAVYCKNLFDGTDEKWVRGDIAGMVAYEKLPEWARQTYDSLIKSAEKETAAPAAAPLDKEQFWQIIDAARESAGGWTEMYEPLVESLSRLEEPDIIRFKQIYNGYQDLAYKEGLWAAAAVMHNGCSDDGFIDFRAWLIAQGKAAYMDALADPDSLAGMKIVQSFGNEVRGSDLTPIDGYRWSASFEALTYAAGDAYKRKLGDDADIYDIINSPLLTVQEYKEMAGEIIYAVDSEKRWNEYGKPWLEALADLKQRCPKLYMLFHDEDPQIVAMVKPGEKESVLEKIKEDRLGKKQTDHNKTKKHDKGGPEL